MNKKYQFETPRDVGAVYAEETDPSELCEMEESRAPSTEIIDGSSSTSFIIIANGEEDSNTDPDPEEDDPLLVKMEVDSIEYGITKPSFSGTVEYEQEDGIDDSNVSYSLELHDPLGTVEIFKIENPNIKQLSIQQKTVLVEFEADSIEYEIIEPWDTVTDLAEQNDGNNESNDYEIHDPQELLQIVKVEPYDPSVPHQAELQMIKETLERTKPARGKRVRQKQTKSNPIIEKKLEEKRINEIQTEMRKPACARNTRQNARRAESNANSDNNNEKEMEDIGPVDTLSDSEEDDDDVSV